MDGTRRQGVFAAGAVAVALAAAACDPAHVQEPPAAASAAAAPAARTLYVEIPSAGNPIANAMMGPAIASSNAVKQLEQVMALGETAPLTVVAYSDNERIALKSVEAALKSFRGRPMPHLTLGVVAGADKVDRLRPLAAPLGVQLVVGQPPK